MAYNKIIFGSNTLLDLTEDTVTADTLLEGYTAHSSSGAIITGTLSAQAQTSRFTGSVDSDGLASIGWNDDDIELYSKYGVLWDSEDNSHHLVSDYDKQIWADYQNGDFVLPTVFSSSNNINSYYPQMEYCPKFDLSSVTYSGYMFQNCYNLVAIPFLDTSNVTNCSSMFTNCSSLILIPDMDFNSSNTVGSMFNGCTSLIRQANLSINATTSMGYYLNGCSFLKKISLNNPATVTNMNGAFNNCYSLQSLSEIDATNITSTTNTFVNLRALTYFYMENIGVSFNLSYSPFLTHDSLIYLINNAQTVSGQTMTLGEVNLAKLSASEIAIATGKGWTLA